MTKIALLTDIHICARNNHQVFAEHMRRFWHEVFFPYLKETGIKHVVMSGDIFDIRKLVYLQGAQSAVDNLFKPLSDMGVQQWILIGNHDAVFLKTNQYNSIRALFGHRELPGMHIIDWPQETTIDGAKILTLPWICSDNLVEVERLRKTSTAKIVIGHFGFSSFPMHKGDPGMDHGDDPTEWKDFDMVISGHYHHRSSRGNIHYLGTQYELTWADYDDQKGFHVLDTDTQELTFIPNPIKIFHKVYYDDSKYKSLEECLSSFTFDDVKGKYVKLVVVNKSQPYWFDLFFDKLEKSEVINLQIVDESQQLYSAYYENNEVIEDTLTILNKYLEGLELDTDKNKLESLMKSLYDESNRVIEPV